MRKLLVMILAIALVQGVSAQKKKKAAPKKAAPKTAVVEPAREVTAPETTAATEAIKGQDAVKADTAEPDIEYSFFGFNNPKPPMEGMERKRRLAQKDIDKKKSGGYFTGLPLVNFDPNTGVGYGARVFYFNNGSKEDKIFEYTPYRHQLFAQYFATTLGWQYHWIDYDAPYIMGSLFRLRTGVIYDKNINAWYFSRGDRSMNNMSFNGTEYGKFKDYEKVIKEIDASGNTNAFRNKYEYERPSMYASLERDMLGGIIRPLVGFQINKYKISDYTGKEVTGEKNTTTGKDKGIQQTTQLAADCAAGFTQGCTGGWVNTAKVGIAFDTRDYEPDPNNGIFWDVVAEFSGKGTGSDYNFQRYTTAPKIFFSPFPKAADMVLAARGVISHTEGDQPFFTQNTMSFTSGNQSGLGGLRSLRGFKADRFVGPTMVMANFEVRWTFADTTVFGQHFAFILAPFFDLGRPFESVQKVSLNNWKNSYGAGFRIAWNQATIIIVDYAMSEEDSAMYINFNHIF